MKKLLVLSALIVFMLFSGVATAALLTTSDNWISWTFTSTSVSDTKSSQLLVTKFDTGLGQLKSVNITWDIDFNQTLAFTNTKTGSKTYAYNTQVQLGISNESWTTGTPISSTGTIKYLENSPTSTGSGSLAGGATWGPTTIINNISNNVPLSPSITDNSTLAAFSGNGNYVFYVLAYLTGSLPTAGNFNSTINTSGTGKINVTYTYDNAPTVPIPAAAWLLGTGLIGLVAIRRRRE